MTKNVKAFTLVELLTVIAIIAVLAALLFPVFSRAKEAAHQANCLSNQKQLATSVALYTADCDDIFPTVTGGPQGAGLVGGWVYYDVFPFGPFDVTKGSLWPYTKSKGIYVCPSDAQGKADGLSYAVNDCLLNPPNPFLGYAYGLSTTIFEDPSTMMLFGEEGDKDSGSGTTNDGGLAFAGDTIGARHNNGTVISFTDSHAKWYAAGQAEAKHVREGDPADCHGQPSS